MENIIIDNFWINLKKLMEEQNRTWLWLSDATNTPLSTLKNGLTQNRSISAELACKIAIALGTSVEYLFTGKPSSKAEEKLKILEDFLINMKDSIPPMLSEN